jgi:hypothetical protein
MQAMPNGGLISISVTADWDDIWIVIDDEVRIPEDISKNMGSILYLKERAPAWGYQLSKHH